MPARQGTLPALLMARLPFFYGWVILACVCCAGFARNGPAVATLSIFVEPMTSELRLVAHRAVRARYRWAASWRRWPRR